MSKRTTIFVLFKEYPDPNGRGKSVPYIQDSADYLTLQYHTFCAIADFYRKDEGFAEESCW